MGNVKTEVKAFLDKCDELKSCKFIMATTKIKDLLKCIASSSDLYMLFKEVTQNFDYLSWKSACLITSNDGYVNRSYVVLPEANSDKLAFIFCLLVEFDCDSINFNEFLQRYYAEDGSYYSSYHVFCDQIISELKNIVSSVFKSELFVQNQADEENLTNTSGTENSPNPYFASILTQIDFLYRKEIDLISKSTLLEEEKECGIGILNELFNAVKQGNISLIEALLNGYHYFSVCNNIKSENFKELFSNVAKLVEALCA